MTLRFLAFVAVVFCVVGCALNDDAKKSDVLPKRNTKHVLINNGKYQADPGVKLLDERPPETEKQYIEKFGQAPDEMLFVKGEDRFYRYVNGRLRALDTTTEPVECPK